MKFKPCYDKDMERSPLAKAAAGLPAAVDYTSRGVESLYSPPPSIGSVDEFCRQPELLEVTRTICNEGSLRTVALLFSCEFVREDLMLGVCP